MSVGSNYEEDLSKNKIFIKYKSDHAILLETAAISNWIICVPRSGSIDADVAASDETFMLSHVLIPDNEIPDYHFINLFGEKYELKGDSLLQQSDSHDKPVEKQILFEEFYYTHDLVKLRIWCLSGSVLNEFNNDADLYPLENSEDAIKYLLKETNSHIIIVIRSVCIKYLSDKNESVGCSIVDLKSNLKQLFDKCLDIILARKSFQNKFEGDAIRMQKLKKAIMTVILLLTHEYNFHIITNRNAAQSEIFNKNMQRMSQMMPIDSDIIDKFAKLLPIISNQIFLLKYLKTPIEKVSCLKNIVQNKTVDGENPSLDDLISLIANSLIKSGYTHWIPTFAYMAELMPLFDNFDCGYEQFLLSTFEAAISFITNWIPPKLKDTSTIEYVYKSKDEFLERFFQLISCNNEKDVLEILNIPISKEIDLFNISLGERRLFAKISIDQQLELCHPLCNCSTCQEKIYEKLPNINSVNEKGLSSLHIAAANGYPKLVSVLLSLGADVNACDHSGLSALHFAAIGGHQSVVLLLLNSNADINKTTKDGETVLHLAAQNGHIGCVKALLFFTDYMNIKFNINQQDAFGNTALHIASIWGFSEIVESLLEYKASPNVKNTADQRPFNVSHNKKIKSIITAYRTEVVLETEVKLSTGQIEHAVNAIKNRDTQLFRYYMEIDSEQNDLFETAGYQPNDIIVNNLGKRYIDIDTVHKGKTLLHLACLYDCPEIVKDLLNYGTDLNRVDKDGRTALHTACKEDNVNCALYLLNYVTVNIINRSDNLGNTALHYVVTNGSWELTQAFLQYSCNSDIRNTQGLNPVDIAKKKNYLNIVALLQKLS